MLSRIILYVQDVERLAAFYTDIFGFERTEAIAGDWAVLAAGGCELALLRAGPAYRVPDPARAGETNNAKLVFGMDQAAFDKTRATLIALGVVMGDVKSYPGLTGELSDGRDPEGNVFQLMVRPA